MTNQEVINSLLQCCPICYQKWIVYKSIQDSTIATCLDCVVQAICWEKEAYLHKGKGFDKNHRVDFPLIEWAILLDNDFTYPQLYYMRNIACIDLPYNLPFTASIEQILKLIPFI